MAAYTRGSMWPAHCEQLGLIGSERLCCGRTLRQGERRLVQLDQRYSLRSDADPFG